jgi:hypothetical protein
MPTSLRQLGDSSASDNLSFAAPLSTHFTDPFVRRAFERAEREDGTAPALMPAEPRKPLQGGAEATKELADA